MCLYVFVLLDVAVLSFCIVWKVVSGLVRLVSRFVTIVRIVRYRTYVEFFRIGPFCEL